MTSSVSYQLRVNGVTYDATSSPSSTLLFVLRDHLGLIGTKFNCEQGECGACTVLLDTRPVNACLVLAVTASGLDITTVEGIGAAGPNAVQEAFMSCDAAQCGYCTPGMVVSGTALLARNGRPTRSDIEEAIAGNYCRCTGYESIINALEQAASQERRHDR